MAHTPYDPLKAHEYYEKHKKLKGRPSGGSKASIGGKNLKNKLNEPGKEAKAKARIGRLRSKIGKLKAALSEVNAELSKKRATSRKTAAKNSDGKTTQAERTSSKQYRDKHKTELATKRKAKSGTSSSSGGSSSSSKNVSGMSVDELLNRAARIQDALKDAQRQLANANQELGQLAHSALLSDPHVNEHFAHFKSAERIPS